MSSHPNFTVGEVSALKNLTGRPEVDDESLKAFSENEREIVAFFHSLPNEYVQGLYTETAFLKHSEQDGGIAEDPILNNIKRDIVIKKYGRSIAKDFVFAVAPIDVHNMIADELDFHVFVYPKKVFGWNEDGWVSASKVFNRQSPPQNKIAEILSNFLDTPVLPNDASRADEGIYRFQERAPGAIALAKEFIDLGYQWCPVLQSYADREMSMDRRPHEPEALQAAIAAYESEYKNKGEREQRAKDAAWIKAQSSTLKMRKTPRLK